MNEVASMTNAHPVYHFTHKKNLPAILQDGGLHCDTDMAGNVEHAVVGNPGIKTRRTKRKVPVGPGGVVADYVPFYFAPRSPMLYVIFRHNVPDCAYPETDVIYFMCDAAALFRDCHCCFTDVNAAMTIAQFNNDPDKLDTFVDWPLMHAHYWNNTPDDTFRMDRRMAEFLVHRFVPWSQVQGIAVFDSKTANMVHRVLNGQQHQPKVAVKPGWYFSGGAS